MSVELDPNAGPLTLHHDTSPRNLANGPAQPQLWQDFRFKGFPDKSFQAPKVPKYKRMSLDLMNQERDDQFFGKTTRFDTVRNQDPKPGNSQSPIDDRREQQYTVRDPLGNLTEEHKYKLQREMRDIEEDKKQRDIIDKLRSEERLEERKKFYEDPYSDYQDKEMLTNYYPWGKPGGGAPTDDSRKQKFLETDLTGSPTPSYRERMERDRVAVQERFRYNQDREEQERYSQELGRQRNEQELRKQEDRLDNLQRELETLKTDNYGKPGGGAPNRTASESFTERRQPMQSMESPRRAPPTNRYDSFNDVGRSLPYADRLARVNREVLPLYHPFGRAGGGAPIKDPRGQVVTQIQGNLNMENYKFQDSTIDQKARDRARAREYYDFLKGQEQEQRRNKQEIEYHMKAPIGELATIMGSKNVGKPVKDPYTGEMRNHHLGNSDVTLQKMNYQPKAISEKKKYHEDLSQLADERMRYKQLNRLKDNQEGMLHHNTMDSLWGRPGGGAPKGYNLRKFNLDSTLHHPSKDGGPFATSNDAYSPRFQPNKYVRSTVTSTHANLYEYPEQLKDKQYALTEPYATF